MTIVSILMGVVRFLSVLRVTVTPGSSRPLIGSTVTWPPPSAIPTSKLSVILQPIASISLVPTSSAIPFLNNWRGLRRAFQVFLVLFVIFCESTGKHLFKIWNSFRIVSHSEIPRNLRQLFYLIFRLIRSEWSFAALGDEPRELRDEDTAKTTAFFILSHSTSVLVYEKL